MEKIISVLLNPITIVAVESIIVIAFIASPYEIYFEDKDEVELD